MTVCEPSRFCFHVPPTLTFPHEFPVFDVHNASFTVRLVQNPRNEEIGVFLRCLSGGPLHLPFTFLVQDEGNVVLANHCDTTQVFKQNVTWGKRNLLTKAKEKLIEDDTTLCVTLVLISGCICGETKNLRICTTCKARYYCCLEHQKNDWNKHKKVCNELAIGGITWMLKRIQTWQKKGILSENESNNLKTKICAQPGLAILDEKEKDVITLLEEKLNTYREQSDTMERKLRFAVNQNAELKKICEDLKKQNGDIEYQLHVSNATMKELELLKTVSEEENLESQSKLKKDIIKKRKKIDELSKRLEKHTVSKKELWDSHEKETKKLRQEIFKQHEKIYELTKNLTEITQNNEKDFNFEEYINSLNFQELLTCRNKTNALIEQKQVCIKCKTNYKEIACLPCGHFCFCQTCGNEIEDCPVCGTQIQEFLQIDR